ncbi:MAG: hypothetical protein MI924_26765, partial [Chloroflexales bacterium]|nr:hypothetical protein [Chloroflexales bacterium]
MHTDPSGLRPAHSPLGNPAGSPAPAAGAVVGRSCGYGPCLRYAGWIDAAGESMMSNVWPSPRLVASPLPRRLALLAI